MINKDYSNLDFLAGQTLLIDKPYKWASFDVVKKIRFSLQKKLNIKKLKVGHAGTLDPLATGLLIICTGKHTKTISSMIEFDKEYIAKIYIGATTPSYDLESEVNNTYPTDHISEELIKQTLKKFIGEQEQIPPVFSAKKIDGERAYEKARQGIDIKMRSAIINIKEIELFSNDFPYIEIKVICSKGTYIRSLARDLGFALESGAYLAGLKRTKIGPYSIENSITLDTFEDFLKKM